MSVARKLLREVLVPIWCRKILKISTRKKFKARAQTKDYYTF
jgi:hypothetical protein